MDDRGKQKYILTNPDTKMGYLSSLCVTFVSADL